MNFAQMLLTPVQPLTLPEEKPKARSGNPYPEYAIANTARRQQGIERLEAVLPKGQWVAGATIANRLGTSSVSANSTLIRNRKAGRLESRRITPDKKALEWRWIP